MAQPESTGYGTVGDEAPMRMSKLAGWLGAATSVALVGGLVWWVADIALRDVRGVPVVRAIEGPARIAPDDPGGFEAAHQGYAVNRIASEKTEEPLSERVVLAPDPVGMAEEDKAPVEVRSETKEPDLKTSVGAALLEALGGVDESGEVDVFVPEPSGALAPRPMQRPDLDVVTRVSASASAPLSLIPASAPAIVPGHIPSGTRLVQLGAFDSEDAALAAWTRLSGEFGNYMNDKGRVVEKTAMADREFWRLRAYGFNTLSDARSFCSVLVAAQADCIPVLTR